MHRINWLAWPLGLQLGLMAVFLVWPEIDLWANGQFWREGDGFFLSQHPFWRGIYETIPYVTKGIVAGTVILWIIVEIRKTPLTWRPVGWINRKAACYILLVLALGPGLMVNTVFKDQWGRARPHQVQAFGGDKEFTPPWVITDQCERNCSFVSGHASVGFFILALAWLFPRHAKHWLIAGVALGLISGLGRMIQGGHFFSDVLFSGLTVFWVSVLVYRVMYRHWPRLTQSS